MRCGAIILAGGRGERAGASVPKAYRLVPGPAGLAPMLRHSMATFLAHPRLDAVRVVIAAEHQLLYAQACEGLEGRKLLAPVIGGATRFASARAGLESLARRPPDLVFLHDGARPFVTAAAIEACARGLTPSYDGALLALPLTDALKRGRGSRLVGSVARDDKNTMWRAQTPQLFRTKKILRAYRALGDAPEPLPADDSEVAERAKLKVRLVEGDTANHKLTFANDFTALRNQDAQPPLIRIGSGFDCHRLGKGRAVMLGGVRVPAPFGVVAHSDGDVVLHALCDALYGALGDGDIGAHFPPSDARHKNRASKDFLAHALARVHREGLRLAQADLLVLAEEPKLAPHRNKILHHLATLVRTDAGAPPPRLSLKATTMEGMGEIGRGEGIGAHALVGLSLA